MATTRHNANGRFRNDLTPEWFDLVDAVEAARILADTPTGPLNFTKLYQLRERGLIEMVDATAATGPRWYRGDVERYARTPLEPVPEVDPMKPAKGVLLACALGAALLGIVGLNVWYWVYR